MSNFSAAQTSITPFSIPEPLQCDRSCPEGSYGCLQVCFRLFRHDKHLVLMFWPGYWQPCTSVHPSWLAEDVTSSSSSSSSGDSPICPYAQWGRETWHTYVVVLFGSCDAKLICSVQERSANGYLFVTHLSICKVMYSGAAFVCLVWSLRLLWQWRPKYYKESFSTEMDESWQLLDQCM